MTGPESTGKTTLVAVLAERLAGGGGVVTSCEAARDYAEARRAALSPNTPAETLLDVRDVEPIARTQLALEVGAEREAARIGAAFVLRDTDLVSTVVYARHYYGAAPAWVEAAARAQRADLYLLCDVDLPWVADGQRDRPHAREALRDAFAAALDEFGCRWGWVRGAGTARLAAAEVVVRQHLGAVCGDGTGMEGPPLPRG